MNMVDLVDLLPYLYTYAHAHMRAPARDTLRGSPQGPPGPPKRRNSLFFNRLVVVDLVGQEVHQMVFNTEILL